MIIVPPIEVTPANLTATNVAITETAWTAGTYTTGTQRYVGTDLYEVVATPSTTDEPTAGAAANPPTWILVGKINRYRMFDFAIGQATTRTSPIEVTITPGQVVNTVALFEFAGADTVQVKVTDPVDGLVYDETVSLVDNTGINNFYAYFFQPYASATEANFFDLPNYSDATVTITITGAGTVGVGETVIGRARTLGVTLMNTTIGIEDFSRKKRDDFGVFRIVERRFAKLGNFDVFLENNQINAALRTLAEFRATPALYVGNVTQPETYILGFYRDFSILRSGPITSEMTLEVEGLV